MFRTSGTSAAAKSSPLGRALRNLAVIRAHVTLQLDHTATTPAACTSASRRWAVLRIPLSSHLHRGMTPLLDSWCLRKLLCAGRWRLTAAGSDDVTTSG